MADQRKREEHVDALEQQLKELLVRIDKEPVPAELLSLARRLQEALDNQRLSRKEDG